MSRLIDADALLQEFETENVAHNSDLWHITGIKAFIENQQTAYDVDEVIEEFEKLKIDANNVESRHHNLMLDICSDIVRRGGVHE